MYMWYGAGSCGAGMKSTIKQEAEDWNRTCATGLGAVEPVWKVLSNRKLKFKSYMWYGGLRTGTGNNSYESTIKHESEFEIIHCKWSCDTGTGNNSYTKYYQTRSWNWNLTMYGYATVRVCIWIWVRICTRSTVKQVSAGGSCTTCAIWIWRYLNNR